MSNDPFLVQDRPIAFHVTEHGEFTGKVSDSTLQQTFKKLCLVDFQKSAKEEQPQLSEKTIILFLPFQNMYL